LLDSLLQENQRNISKEEFVKKEAIGR